MKVSPETRTAMSESNPDRSANVGSALNDTQIQYWNGRAGSKWVAEQANLDAMLAGVTVELRARAGSVAGERVLDIGCGTGETCGLWLAGGATVTGVDVSAPMLALAAKRTGGKVTLVEADASVWKAKEPFDRAFSRFGVMFFEAPQPAFQSIASNLRPGGRLLFACWRAPSENPWATTPLDAIRDLLPESPPPVPNAPGPFAFASGERVKGILEGAGFEGVQLHPFDFEVCLATTGGLDAAVAFVLQIGPAAAALAEVEDAVRAKAKERLYAALAPHVTGDRVALRGATWIVEGVRGT